MPAKWEITLPWPDKALSPNARCHWSVKSAQVKRYRYTCKLLTLKAIRSGSWDVQTLRELVAAGGQVHVFLDFYPPDRRPETTTTSSGVSKAAGTGWRTL